MEPSDATKANRIELFNLKTIQMRTFHLTWASFFLCFFGWFGIAPLMAVVREDLGLTKSEIGLTIIASVAITVLVRLVVGPLCDRIGPRKAYAGLMILGAFPVMLIGLANNFETFLAFRLAIGAIGASFVITQYHTSVMFAPNIVGTANATTAGWGNLGGGEWLTYRDGGRGRYRFATLRDGMLSSCLFIAPDPVLPPRGWLAGLFAHVPLSPDDRLSLLTGAPTNAQSEQGGIICACRGVGRGTIEAAIAADPSVTVIGLGAATGAGTNCSSCQPELAQLISAHGGLAETA